jgi:hypothetical protein
MGWGFHQVEGGAAIHAAKSLRGDDRKSGGDPMVERPDFRRFLMGEGTGINQGRAFAEGAMGGASFEKS